MGIFVSKYIINENDSQENNIKHIDYCLKITLKL